MICYPAILEPIEEPIRIIGSPERPETFRILPVVSNRYAYHII